MRRLIIHAYCFLFVTVLVLATAGPSPAANEVQNPLPVNADTGVEPQQPPDETLTVQWDKLDAQAMLPDVLLGYVYLWNNSNAALDDTALNQDVNDGSVGVEEEIPAATKDNADFAAEDYNDPAWYLHIKTVYSVGGITTYSTDVIVGPFNFDNVAPDGSITLDTEVDGQTATTSTVNPVTLEVNATPDTETVYLNNTSSRPDTGTTPDPTIQHDVGDDPGTKNIYAWFEDRAGNISDFILLTMDLIAGKSIDPAGDFELDVGDKQTFIVLGKTQDETFDWEINDPDTGAPTDTASIDGGQADNQPDITVTADAEGAFRVKATSTSDSVYESGVITVIQTITTKTYSLITTATTSVNAIVLARENTGYSKASELKNAIPNCDGLSRWNAQLQAYESYVPVFNDFDLTVGEPYFVSVSADTDFDVTGTVPENVTYDLITTETTSVNAISIPNAKANLTKASELKADIPNCDGLSRWNAQLQAYESYVQIFNDFDVNVDGAYFVSISSNGIWP